MENISVKILLRNDYVIKRLKLFIEELELNYKLMDLSNPMIDESDKEYLKELAEDQDLNYIPKTFLEMYDEDQIGGIIRNVEFWLQDVFEQFKK